MHTLLKTIRFSLKTLSPRRSRPADAPPSGLLSTAELRRLVADMVD
ncbi:hypothetical protein GTZ99_00900 [Novosphingobium sp. FSY-8]|uniref:Uncharacterized protein n=1 Tax=Novosphingobium ovatum TaxID=1908523 RepID=A0ABW9X9A6_9SPHN|nr:hypothetical protein [Novosphingobium ovatum]NBC35112.1 hypothetical protein [Novosphingobium ovatum]